LRGLPLSSSIYTQTGRRWCLFVFLPFNRILAFPG
jgi:hypothetical protein